MDRTSRRCGVLCKGVWSWIRRECRLRGGGGLAPMLPLSDADQASGFGARAGPGILGFAGAGQEDFLERADGLGGRLCDGTALLGRGLWHAHDVSAL